MLSVGRSGEVERSETRLAVLLREINKIYCKIICLWLQFFFALFSEFEKERMRKGRFFGKKTCLLLQQIHMARKKKRRKKRGRKSNNYSSDGSEVGELRSG